MRVCIGIAVRNSCGGVDTIPSDEGLTLFATWVQRELTVAMHQVKVGVAVAVGCFYILDIYNGKMKLLSYSTSVDQTQVYGESSISGAGFRYQMKR